MKAEKKFIPLSHEHLELKNGLLNYARELKKQAGFENQLASTFIYVGFAEYLANNLLENLRHFIHTGSYNQFAGILFIDERHSEGIKTFGQTIGNLGKFNFPDNQGIIRLLSDINQARNRLYHNFVSADPKKMEEIMTNDIVSIQEKTEEVLAKINVIYAGLQKILMPHRCQVQENYGDTS